MGAPPRIDEDLSATVPVGWVGVGYALTCERRQGAAIQMGRIIAQTTVTNRSDGDKSIECGMLVDTGAGAMILPGSWKARFGRFLRTESVELQLANQEVVHGEACGPVEIRIHGFRPVWNEAIFLDAAEGEDAEPHLGYVVLEQAQAAVDMLGHRLVPVRYIDMK